MIENRQTTQRTKHNVTYLGVTKVENEQFLGHFPQMAEYQCTCGFHWWGTWNPEKQCLRRDELIARLHGPGTY